MHGYSEKGKKVGNPYQSFEDDLVEEPHGNFKRKSSIGESKRESLLCKYMITRKFTLHYTVNKTKQNKTNKTTKQEENKQ